MRSELGKISLDSVFAERDALNANVVAAMNAEIRTIMAMDDVKARLIEQGIEARGSTPDEFRAIILKEQQRWGRVIKDANIPPKL